MNAMGKYIMKQIEYRIALLKPKKDEIISPKPMGGEHKTKTVRRTNSNFIPLYLDTKRKAINDGT
jgi:hypothetical protein